MWMHIKTPFGLREKQAKAIHPKKKKQAKVKCTKHRISVWLCSCFPKHERKLTGPSSLSYFLDQVDRWSFWAMNEHSKSRVSFYLSGISRIFSATKRGFRVNRVIGMRELLTNLRRKSMLLGASTTLRGNVELSTMRRLEPWSASNYEFCHEIPCQSLDSSSFFCFQINEVSPITPMAFTDNDILSSRNFVTNKL